jgi:hypothetical protein
MQSIGAWILIEASERVSERAAAPPSTLCYLLLTSLRGIKKVNRFFFHSKRIRIGNIEREILRAGWQINLVSLYEMCHTHKTWSIKKAHVSLSLSLSLSLCPGRQRGAAAFVPSGTLDLFPRTKGLS